LSLAATTVLSVIVAFPLAAQARAPEIWAGLTPGPYLVGYRELAPPKPCKVWYPASSAEAAMTFGKYLGGDLEKTRALLTSAGFSKSAVDELVSSSFYAAAARLKPIATGAAGRRRR
jgi:hypothetical protein